MARGPRRAPPAARIAGMPLALPDTPTLQALLNRINRDARALFGQGRVADYIPALAEVAPQRFGLALAMVDGRVLTVGEAQQPFSLQSITKLFTFVLALKAEGEALWQRVGREPSGAAFNSIVQLETENGIPRNPFINAGALVITDILTSRYAHLDYALLGALRRLADAPDLYWNPRVADSERRTAWRNLAMACFMKSHGNFRNEPEQVLDNYCRQCATEMNCAQLAKASLFLAHDGVDLTHDGRPGEMFLSADQTRRVNALMLTCGAYDAAGDFAYRIGLPVKTGVGGGIVAIVPGVGSVVVWSPELDTKGNSVAGAFALERLVQATGWGHTSI